MPLFCTSLSLYANSVINPSVFVSIDPTKAHSVIQASGTAFLIGIAQKGTEQAPGIIAALGGTGPSPQPAANPGDNIEVFHQGDVCGLVVGSAAVNPGDQLTNDSSGQALTAITGNGVSLITGRYIGAIALSAGQSGDIIDVVVAYSKS